MTDLDMDAYIDGEDDPIVSSYDIFIKPHISEGREIYILQFPNRDIEQRYAGSNDAQPLKFRTKPKAGMVEMDVPIDARRNYDKDKGVKWGDAIKKSNMVKGGGSHGLPGGFGIGGAQPSQRGRGRAQELDPEKVLADFEGAIRSEQVLVKQTLGGQIIPVDKNSPNYFLGAFQKEKQNRPREGPAPKVTEARAIHMTVKSNIDGEEDRSDNIAVRISAAQQEQWVKHRYVDEDHQAAWECYHENMFIYAEQDENGDEQALSIDAVPRLTTGMDDMAYIDTISAPNNAAKMSRAKVDSQTIDLDDDEEE